MPSFSVWIVNHGVLLADHHKVRVGLVVSKWLHSAYVSIDTGDEATGHEREHFGLAHYLPQKLFVSSDSVQRSRAHQQEIISNARHATVEQLLKGVLFDIKSEYGRRIDYTCDTFCDHWVQAKEGIYDEASQPCTNKKHGQICSLLQQKSANLVVEAFNRQVGYAMSRTEATAFKINSIDKKAIQCELKTKLEPHIWRLTEVMEQTHWPTIVLAPRFKGDIWKTRYKIELGSISNCFCLRIASLDLNFIVDSELSFLKSFKHIKFIFVILNVI